MVGESPRIHTILEVLKRPARADANVVIYREPGSGKELVARMLHSITAEGGIVWP